MYHDIESFYRSKEWEAFRAGIIAQRVDPSTGSTLCSHCGKPIVRRGDIILHHIEELTPENVLLPEKSLSPENVEIVCLDCHNREHKRFGYHHGGTNRARREVVVVCGAPCAGKSTYVSAHAQRGDLVVDIDRIWEMVGLHPQYDKPDELKEIVFSIRDALFDAVKYRQGHWRTAWIIDGGATEGKRQRLLRRVGGEKIIFLSTPQAVCLERSKGKGVLWGDYVRNYFSQFDGVPDYAEKIDGENPTGEPTPGSL